MIPSLNGIEILVKGATSVLLGVKGLIFKELSCYCLSIFFLRALLHYIANIKNLYMTF